MSRNSMKTKLQKFFYGRYGMDEWSRLGVFFSIFLNIFNLWLKKDILTSISLVLFIYFGIYRVFSKNIYKRQLELTRFNQRVSPLRRKFKKVKTRLHTKRTKKEIVCPHCQEKCRIPRGKGTVKITCPHCHKKFISKS